jgi:putative endonuclease
MPYWVYVIRNWSGQLYVGVTFDVSERLEDHNTGRSRWTKGRGPWELIWKREMESLGDARRFELRLKRQGRGQGFYKLTGISHPSRS